MSEDEPGLRGPQLAADLVRGVGGVSGAHGEAKVEAAEDDGGVLEAVGEQDTDHVTLAEAEPRQGPSNLEGLISDLNKVNFVSPFYIIITHFSVEQNLSSNSTGEPGQMSVLLNVIPDIVTICHLRNSKVSP